MAISLLSNALAKRGYSVTILCIYNLGEVAYRLETGIQIEYLTDVTPNRESFLKAKKERKIFDLLKEGLYSIRVLYLKTKKMKDAIKNIEDGIVISTRNEHSVILSKYGNQNVYKIAQLHHDHEFKKKYIKDFQQHYKNIDKFVLLTPGLKDEVEKMMQGYNAHTHCVAIPNFLEVTINDAASVQREKTVIAVGRLHPVKGLERLIDMWKVLLQTHPDWNLKIVGGGELEDTLRDQVENMGIGGNVNIIGALEHDKVLEEMKRASLYVMSSYSEAFPFVLIEAMSCGLPPVAFDVRVGPRAIIEHNKDGFLAEDGNKTQFVEYIDMLISNPSVRAKMSLEAVSKAQTFAEENVMIKWEKLLEHEEYGENEV